MDIEKIWEWLVQHQAFADANGFGPEWARMCEERTQDTVWEAAYAAEQAAEAAWVPVSEAIWANPFEIHRPWTAEEEEARNTAASVTYMAEDMVIMAGRAFEWIRSAEGKNDD